MNLIFYKLCGILDDHKINSGRTIMTDEKRNKFVKLAEKRTANAIKSIRIIGKLGNKSHYEYEEKDVKKIVGALSKEVESLKHRLSEPGGKEEIDFKL
jgi:hypothetical protein